MMKTDVDEDDELWISAIGDERELEASEAVVPRANIDLPQNCPGRPGICQILAQILGIWNRFKSEFVGSIGALKVLWENVCFYS